MVLEDSQCLPHVISIPFQRDKRTWDQLCYALALVSTTLCYRLFVFLYFPYNPPVQVPLHFLKIPQNANLALKWKFYKTRSLSSHFPTKGTPRTAIPFHEAHTSN